MGSRPVVVAFIVHGIVAVWIVSWLTLMEDGLYLGRVGFLLCAMSRKIPNQREK